MSNYNTVIVNLLLGLYRNLDKNIEEKVGYAGGNTGNIIFTEAMKEYLDYKSEIWLNARALSTVKNPSVIIPSANFIRVGEESLFEAIIRFLNQTDCPVTMAGLGAQAKTGTKPSELVKEISLVQVKALKMISERAKVIGVRGEFTAECLNLLGIHNLKIIGCPSFYFREKDSVYPINLNHTQVTISPMSRNDNLLLDKAMQWDSIWIMQMLTELPQIAQTVDLNIKNRSLIQKTYLCSPSKVDRIWQYMKERSKIYFDYDEWKSIYKYERIGFAYGSRFHGNMMAFRNGIPALWITHDIRTEELVKTLHLPNINFETFRDIDTLDQLIKYCDYTECFKYSKSLHQQYIDFLNENNIKLKRNAPPQK